MVPENIAVVAAIIPTAAAVEKVGISPSIMNESRLKLTVDAV